MSCRFIWYELQTINPEACEAFYQAVLGWTVSIYEMETGPYRTIVAGDRAIGGIRPLAPGDDLPSRWLGYITAGASVDEAANQAVIAGGSLLTAPFDLPGVGRLAVVRDPWDALFSLFIPSGESPETTENYPFAPGLPVWNELVTPDPMSAAHYYRAFTDWQTEDVANESGTFIRVTNRYGEVGSIVAELPGVAASCWVPYFTLPRNAVDSALQAVSDSAGHVTLGPVDVPAVGVTIIAIDPSGVPFGMIAG
jgi:uncharacterized protein